MGLSKATTLNAKEIWEGEKPWVRGAAAASLIAGAVLLVAGRKRTALAVVAGGAAVTLLERPEAAQELWTQLPGYIRQGQDFLIRAEGFVERLGEQAMRIRETVARVQQQQAS